MIVMLAGYPALFVTEGVDEGPIIIQAALPIFDNDTPETLAERILVQERKIYPRAVQLFRRRAITGQRPPGLYRYGLTWQ
jgi:folate-dependent phosphoribosylglycinamide formyltransferase PurN